MLEGEGSGLSGSAGAGDAGTDPASSQVPASGSTGSQSASGGGGAASLVSGDSGSAPAVSGDAVASEAGAVPTPPAAAAKFRFANREWDSQKQAEDAYKASFGRNWEGKIAEAQKTLAEREAEIQALRSALAGRGNGQEQGVQRGAASSAPDASAPFVERLAKDGSLDFLASLLQTGEGEDPTLGVKRFTLGLADVISREVEGRVGQLQEQHIAPILRRQAFNEHMGSAMGVVRSLAGEFPELEDSNASPEAVEHQQAFVENLKQFPPEVVASNPQFAMLAAALVTRYQHGTPVFAQTPGTSGSPSALAVAASEQALGRAAGVPIGGTGTPRPRPAGTAETDEDRIRRENAEVSIRLQSPSGRDLGFGPA